MFTFDKGAKSFMVWAYGMYPTNGMEYECKERATVSTTNSTHSTGSSGSSSGLDDIVIP
jgi:hypothetical protein